MKKWHVLKNPIGGVGYIWQVYRIRNPKEPMHAGNIETDGKVYESEEAAQAAADWLNGKGRKEETL